MKQQKTKLTNRSFRHHFLGEMERMKQQGLRCPSDPVVDCLFTILGPQAQLPPDSQTPASFAGVRASVINSGLAENLIFQQLNLLRRILRRLVPMGLKPECIDALAWVRTASRRSGIPELQKSSVKTVMQRLTTQLEIIRLLIWIVLSGALQLIDSVCLEFANIDWDTGLICYRRPKSGDTARFAALPPLMVILRERRARFGPNAKYVMPELMFTQVELKDPECNTIRWETIPHLVLARASAKAISLISEFFKHCGLEGGALNYKSLRAHLISFWAGIGIRSKTRMRMCGRHDETSHNRLDVPLDTEILAARDITWKYLQALLEDGSFEYPTTAYAVQESLRHISEGVRNDIKASVDQLQGNVGVEFSRMNGQLERLAECVQKLADQNHRLLAGISLPASA
jgi:hypothetical protein